MQIGCLHKHQHPVQVSESIEVMGGWIRYVNTGSNCPPMEIGINIHVVAAEPVAWGMTIVAGNSQPTPRDQGEIQCGVPFTLEVDAQDNFGNRWTSVCGPDGVVCMCYTKVWALKYMLSSLENSMWRHTTLTCSQTGRLHCRNNDYATLIAISR